MAKKMKIQKFKASPNWLWNFKVRFGLVKGKQHGEAIEVDIDELSLFQENELKQNLQRYHPDNVYNIDESSLFWKAFPRNGVFFKGWLVFMLICYACF